RPAENRFGQFCMGADGFTAQVKFSQILRFTVQVAEEEINRGKAQLCSQPCRKHTAWLKRNLQHDRNWQFAVGGTFKKPGVCRNVKFSRDARSVLEIIADSLNVEDARH